MGLALAVRSERRSLASLGPFSNPALLAAVTLTVALQFIVVYLPAANAVFKTEPLSAPEMIICAAAGLSVLLAVELNKWRMRSG
jgi:Ca2+-transporting ATPase